MHFDKSCFLLSQLDDWVLCRVQQKGNTSKSTCNSQDSSNPEFWNCLPKVEQTQPAYANPNTDIIKDFLYKDCRLLASILAGQAPPISSVSFQGTNDGYEVGTNKVNSTISISSLGIISDTLQRKSIEEITKENPFRIDNNLESKNNDVDVLPSKQLEGNYINCYNPNHSQNDILKANATDTTNFEELNEMAILGRYFAEI